MVSRIPDSRIGIRTRSNGRITQFPSRYADGGLWNRLNNPAPTTVFFGPGRLFFYTLPVGKARIDVLTRQELESIVTSHLTEEDVTDANIARQGVAVEPAPQTVQAAQEGSFVVENTRTQFASAAAPSTAEGQVVVGNFSQALTDEDTDISLDDLFDDVLPNSEDK